MMRNVRASMVMASTLLAAPAFAEDESEVVVAEEPGWESSVDFGLSLSKGNTENMLLRFGIQTAKKDEVNAYAASANYNYGEENDKANEDEILVKASFKHNFAGKNFFGLILDGRRDEFADIDYRISVAGTYGYYWIDTETTILSTEFGVGVTTEDKGLGNDTYINGLFDQHFEHKFNDSAKIYQDLSFAPRIDDVDDYRVDFVIGLETKITETIAFRVSFEDRYESMPADGKEKNDAKFLTGLSYKF